MNCLKLLAILSLILSLGACAKATVSQEGDVVSTTSIADNPLAYDGKHLLVKGYLVANALNAPKFYITRQAAEKELDAETLDLFPVSDDVHDQARLPQITCVIASGTFETYTHGKIAFGIFSKYGAFHLERFTVCKD